MSEVQWQWNCFERAWPTLPSSVFCQEQLSGGPDDLAGVCGFVVFLIYGETASLQKGRVDTGWLAMCGAWFFLPARYQNELAGVDTELLAERFYYQALSVAPQIGE